MAEDTFTTIRIFRQDRPALEKLHQSAAVAVHSLLAICDHPVINREHLGKAQIFYPEDRRLVTVSIYRCRECGKEIVLPGEPAGEKEPA